MNLFLATFESVAVLLGIGIIGFYIIRKKVLPAIVLQSLSPLALEIALPSLIFVNIINDFSPQRYPEWWQLPIWWLIFTIVAAVLTFSFKFVSKKKSRKEFALSLFYQNGLFFPLAILTGMFNEPEAYIIPLFLFTLFYPAFFFGTYQFFFPKSHKDAYTFPIKRILHPAFIATIISIILILVGARSHIPDLFISILTILGAMTVPLLMIILGGNVFVDTQLHQKIQIIEILKFVIIKNFVFPLIFLVLLIPLKPYITYTIALIILLQSAVPPLTAIPIVTERLQGDRSLASQLLVGSFLTSLVSIPLVVFLFGILFQ